MPSGLHFGCPEVLDFIKDLASLHSLANVPALLKIQALLKVLPKAWGYWRTKTFLTGYDSLDVPNLFDAIASSSCNHCLQYPSSLHISKLSSVRIVSLDFDLIAHRPSVGGVKIAVVDLIKANIHFSREKMTGSTKFQSYLIRALLIY